MPPPPPPAIYKGGVEFSKFYQKERKGLDFYHKNGGCVKIGGCFKKTGVLYHLFAY